MTSIDDSLNNNAVIFEFMFLIEIIVSKTHDKLNLFQSRTGNNSYFNDIKIPIVLQDFKDNLTGNIRYFTPSMMPSSYWDAFYFRHNDDAKEVDINFFSENYLLNENIFINNFCRLQNI